MRSQSYGWVRLSRCVVLSAALVGCSQATTVDAGAIPPGEERGPCFGNGTCNAGLSCASDVCVRLDDATLSDASTDRDASVIDALMGGDAAGLDGAGTPDTSASGCANAIPSSDPAMVSPPYGAHVGETFREFGVGSGASFTPTPLSDCAGMLHSFYAEQYCDAAHRFTVVTLAAGWNHPSQMESGLITMQLVNPYQPRGVRVIQILVQDPNYSAPSTAFCQQWVSTYGLTSRPNAMGMGNYELLDPNQVTNPYFPDGVLPVTLIVDHRGVIRYSESGNSTLSTVTSQLDMLLAGP